VVKLPTVAKDLTKEARVVSLIYHRTGYGSDLFICGDTVTENGLDIKLHLMENLLPLILPN
jgi:hypothetical protein